MNGDGTEKLSLSQIPVDFPLENVRHFYDTPK